MKKEIRKKINKYRKELTFEFLLSLDWNKDIDIFREFKEIDDILNSKSFLDELNEYVSRNSDKLLNIQKENIKDLVQKFKNEASELSKEEKKIVYEKCNKLLSNAFLENKNYKNMIKREFRERLAEEDKVYDNKYKNLEIKQGAEKLLLNYRYNDLVILSTLFSVDGSCADLINSQVNAVAIYSSLSKFTKECPEIYQSKIFNLNMDIILLDLIELEKNKNISKLDKTVLKRLRFAYEDKVKEMKVMASDDEITKAYLSNIKVLSQIYSEEGKDESKLFNETYEDFKNTEDLYEELVYIGYKHVLNPTLGKKELENLRVLLLIETLKEDIDIDFDFIKNLYCTDNIARVNMVLTEYQERKNINDKEFAKLNIEFSEIEKIINESLRSDYNIVLNILNGNTNYKEYNRELFEMTINNLLIKGNVILKNKSFLEKTLEIYKNLALNPIDENEKYDIKYAMRDIKKIKRKLHD